MVDGKSGRTAIGSASVCILFWGGKLLLPVSGLGTQGDSSSVSFTEDVVERPAELILLTTEELDWDVNPEMTMQISTGISTLGDTGVYKPLVSAQYTLPKSDDNVNPIKETTIKNVLEFIIAQ
ncbi:hypothetical protein C4D60_Mb06t22460 [Musa balbisiana]|uniref:Uncharacterized protein n=1 Tax=Musa balbisiana TaxID=52838 RepID=A0A4S8IQ05_MUSBA|nr:hypothetical protein C4D60_Mb06t22460 [Musa balbisiana]